MRIYYDIRTDRLVSIPGTQTLLTNEDFKRGAEQRCEIQFGESPDGTDPLSVVAQPSWTVASLPTTLEMILAIKEAGKYEQDPPLCMAQTWTYDATDQVYILKMDVESTILDALLNHDGYGSGQTFTADAGTDALTATAHGLSDGDQVHVSSTTTLPDPLAADTDYFVISATTNTFQLATTSGGSAIDLTDAGTGTHTVTQNPDDTNDTASVEAMLGFAWRESNTDGWRKPLNYVTATVYHDEVNAGESGFTDAVATAPDARYTLSTTDATFTEIAAVAIADGDTLGFRALLCARQDDGDSAMWEFKGCIKNDGGTTAFVGTPTKEQLAADAGATSSAWDADVDDDDTADELLFEVQGAASENINWTMLLETILVQD